MIKEKEPEGMERFSLIMNWCKEHPLKCKDVYENNAYAFKHRCEKDLGFYVSADDVACCYKLLGNKVKETPNGIGHIWKIYRKQN